jgi:hypothetical protein
LKAAPVRPAAEIKLGLEISDAGSKARGFAGELHTSKIPGGGGGKIPPVDPSDRLTAPGGLPPETPGSSGWGRSGGGTGEPPHGPGGKKLPPNPKIPFEPDSIVSRNAWAEAVGAGLVIGRRNDGRIVIYRTGPGGTHIVEQWNQRDAIYAVTKELRAGGSAADNRPLRVVFDRSYTDAEAQNFLKSVRVHVERYITDGVPQPVVLFKPATQAGMARLNASLKSVVPKAFEVTADGVATRVTGSIRLTDMKSTSFDVACNVRVTDPKQAITPAAAKKAVEQVGATAASKGHTVEDLGVNIYNELQKLGGGRDTKGSALFTIQDAGDLHIVLDNEHGRVEVVVAVRGDL